MAIKTTFTSDHPEFVPFSTWIINKIAQAQAANNTAEVNRIQEAINAKINANPNMPQPTDMDVKPNSYSFVLEEETVAVPSFNEFWNAWIAEYNVVEHYETV